MRNPRQLLTDKEKRVIALINNGESFEDIGLKFSCTAQYIRHIKKTADYKLGMKYKDFPSLLDNRARRILQELGYSQKKQVAEHVKKGMLHPDFVFDLGQKTYEKICEWTGAEDESGDVFV